MNVTYTVEHDFDRLRVTWTHDSGTTNDVARAVAEAAAKVLGFQFSGSGYGGGGGKLCYHEWRKVHGR